jgi:hypothetical protein
MFGEQQLSIGHVDIRNPRLDNACEDTQDGVQLGHSKECVARNLCYRIFIRKYKYQQSF